jgi:hypothetical protein
MKKIKCQTKDTLAMSINVYWASLNEEWMRATKPQPVLSNFLKNNDNLLETKISMCPSFKDYLKNTYSLRSIYDYNFKIENASVVSNKYNQSFFDKNVNIRSVSEKTFSFNLWNIFFTEESSLKITQLPPFLEDNNVTRNCICFPGTYDIGKWFRNLDFAFKLKEGHDSFLIENNEIYSYIQFHTKENINFIQYRHTDKIASYLADTMNSRSYKKYATSLSEYYDIFKVKSKIIKEIKLNILE